MTKDEFAALLARLGLSRRKAAAALGIHLSMLERYRTGKVHNIPSIVADRLRELVHGPPPKPRRARVGG